MLNIYHIGTAENVLGYGKRIVVWLTGCPFNCFNCIEDKLRYSESGKPVIISEIYKMIKDEIHNTDGITFSGGEPLLQAKGVLQFLELLPSAVDKMLFTGYEPAEMDEIQTECFKRFDLAVTGRFINEKRGNFQWRGSSNKRFYSPTCKYSVEYLEELYKKESAGLEITISDGKLLFYGIPTDRDEIEIIINKLYDNDIKKNEIIEDYRL